MGTAHLIYGPVAAGKSTFALRLAADRHAVRFAIDEWMHTLFGPDARPDMDLPWAMARVARCQATMKATCERILASGGEVILELGMMRVEERERARSWVESIGHQPVLYFVDADPATRRQRVERRNAEQGATYTFAVTPGMFEAIERHFERPNANELEHVVVVVDSSACHV